LEKAKLIEPKCCKVLTNFAVVYMKKSENDLAKDYLIKACELKPKCTDVWTHYAFFLFMINDLKAAELVYVRILHLNSELYKVPT